MKKNVVLVFDCGSTNIRVAAVDEKGNIVAQKSKSNAPIQQPNGKPGWLIWDIDEIWNKLCLLTHEVLSILKDRYSVKAVTVTTWGADGALVRKDGSLVYPAISWQCPRTKEIAQELPKLMDPWEIFRITGYQIIYFNTLLKLIWLRRYAPNVFKEAYTWLMMPGLIAYRLTGVFHIDPTSASTMMAMDLGKRDWSVDMLSLANLDASFFPPWKEPGDIVGYITQKAHNDTGLPENLPVVVSGHDTQFAIMASGIKGSEAVLSSGTWEILGLRMDSYKPNKVAFEEGVIIEADVKPGMWNPQLLMIASAVLEWIRKYLYPELKPGEYEVMINEARRIPPGSNGVFVIPSFVTDSGPTKKYFTRGTMLGLSLLSSRAHIYKSTLEGLSYQLRLALEILEKAFNIKIKCIRVVGGGSKNNLWNEIRADITGIPILITGFSEATVLGAALTAFTGIGIFNSLNEALNSIQWNIRIFSPSNNKFIYDKLYNKIYKEALQVLKQLYQKWYV